MSLYPCMGWTLGFKFCIFCFQSLSTICIDYGYSTNTAADRARKERYLCRDGGAGGEKCRGKGDLGGQPDRWVGCRQEWKRTGGRCGPGKRRVGR